MHVCINLISVISLPNFPCFYCAVTASQAWCGRPCSRRFPDMPQTVVCWLWVPKQVISVAVICQFWAQVNKLFALARRPPEFSSAENKYARIECKLC